MVPNWRSMALSSFVHALKLVDIAMEEQLRFFSSLMREDPVRIQRPTKVSHKVVQAEPFLCRLGIPRKQGEVGCVGMKEGIMGDSQNT